MTKLWAIMRGLPFLVSSPLSLLAIPSRPPPPPPTTRRSLSGLLIQSDWLRRNRKERNDNVLILFHSRLFLLGTSDSVVVGWPQLPICQSKQAKFQIFHICVHCNFKRWETEPRYLGTWVLQMIARSIFTCQNGGTCCLSIYVLTLDLALCL